MRRLLTVTAVLVSLASLTRAADPPARPTPVKTEMPGVWVEVYTDRAAFDARLGGKVNVVDFDDVETAKSDVAPFEADRYKEKFGVVVTGTDGQYAGRTFGYANDYVPKSKPNMYAPDPKTGQGGCETLVTFADGGRTGAVVGFGCLFIDADYPGLGPCALIARDAAGKELFTEKGFSGQSGAAVFRGIITVDAKGLPVPVIQSVKLVNGNGWPANGSNEGVTLDDFVFSPPVAQTNPATPTAPALAPSNSQQPSTTPPPVSPPGAPPMPGERKPGAPAAVDLVDVIVKGFKPGEISADTRTVIAAMLKGDTTEGRAALARNKDAHAEALRLSAGLLDNPIIDPFSLIAYTFNYHEPSAAFIPNGVPDPVSVVTVAVTRRAEIDAEMRPYFADAIKAMCVIQLTQNLRADKPVGLSDHILFSSLRTRPKPNVDKRSSADQKRYGALPDPDPLLAKARGAIDHEELCSDPEERKRYLGKANAPRYWFLERNVRKDGYYLCTGLWYNALTFADKCDPKSRERWDKVFTAVAQAYADDGRYTSALIVKMLSSTNAVPFLVECAKRVDPKDTKRVTSLTIAFGYFLEATRGKWSAGLKGTTLGELHDKLAEFAQPAELDMARRCGGVDRKTFEKAP